MKRLALISGCLVILIGAVLCLFLNGPHQKGPVVSNGKTNCLRSAELIATETSEAIYQRHRVPGTRELFRHDVKVYRLIYTTRDVDGTEVTVSGAVLAPAVAGPSPTMSYHRGTIIPVHNETWAPSYYNLENNQSIY